MHASFLANVVGPDGLIIIIVVVLVLLFGGSKLPKLARGLGAASHEFRKGMEDGEEGARKGEPTKPDSEKAPDVEEKDTE